MYSLTLSISRGVENYFPRLWGMGISDVIFYRYNMVSNWGVCTNSEMSNSYFSVPFIMSKLACKLNTFAFRIFVKYVIRLLLGQL